MPKIATRNAHEYIARQDEFETHGSMRGRKHTPGTYAATGFLPDEYKDGPRNATYIVYSYGTPIAWTEPVTGHLVVPAVKYSNTTGKHQTQCRMGAF